MISIHFPTRIPFHRSSLVQRCPLGCALGAMQQGPGPPGPGPIVPREVMDAPTPIISYWYVGTLVFEPFWTNRIHTCFLVSETTPKYQNSLFVWDYLHSPAKNMDATIAANRSLLFDCWSNWICHFLKGMCFFLALCSGGCSIQERLIPKQKNPNPWTANLIQNQPEPTSIFMEVQ